MSPWKMRPSDLDTQQYHDKHDLRTRDFEAKLYSSKPSAHNIVHPPSLCPPPAVVVATAVLQMSSNAGRSSSPVTAEHSTYRSARISWALAYASCG